MAQQDTVNLNSIWAAKRDTGIPFVGELAGEKIMFNAPSDGVAYAIVLASEDGAAIFRFLNSCVVGNDAERATPEERANYSKFFAVVAKEHPTAQELLALLELLSEAGTGFPTAQPAGSSRTSRPSGGKSTARSSSRAQPKASGVSRPKRS
jgi:hypothetical protein